MYRSPNEIDTCVNKGITSYGSDNRLAMDKICAFVLVIAPLLQHYKGFYQNAGFSALLLIFPYIMLKLWNKIWNSSTNRRCIVSIAPLILFQIYRIIAGKFEITTIAYGVFFALLFLAIARGCVNIGFFIKCATAVCVAASVLLILQYASFYLLGTHIQLVPTSLLLPESDIWIAGAKTGLIGVNGAPNGFYRPSAFFLEPSHLFIYCFPMLCIWLLSPNMSNKKLITSILVTIAIVLSTSGMGIVISAGLWGLFIFFYRDKEKTNIPSLHNLFTKTNLFLLIGWVVLLVVLYTQVGIVQNSINRIFTSSSFSKSTAISGRTEQARMLIDKMSGSSIIFGLTDDVSGINFNFPGFFSTLYKYGVIGLILSYWYYVKGIIRLKGEFFWICFIIVAISFFTAHTHGTFYMLYYIVILAEGYYLYNDSPINKVYK